MPLVEIRWKFDTLKIELVFDRKGIINTSNNTCIGAKEIIGGEEDTTFRLNFNDGEVGGESHWVFKLLRD